MFRSHSWILSLLFSALAFAVTVPAGSAELPPASEEILEAVKFDASILEGLELLRFESVNVQ